MITITPKKEEKRDEETKYKVTVTTERIMSVTDILDSIIEPLYVNDEDKLEAYMNKLDLSTEEGLKKLFAYFAEKIDDPMTGEQTPRWPDVKKKLWKSLPNHYLQRATVTLSSP